MKSNTLSSLSMFIVLFMANTSLSKIKVINGTQKFTNKQIVLQFTKGSDQKTPILNISLSKFKGTIKPGYDTFSAFVDNTPNKNYYQSLPKKIMKGKTYRLTLKKRIIITQVK